MKRIAAALAAALAVLGLTAGAAHAGNTPADFINGLLCSNAGSCVSADGTIGDLVKGKGPCTTCNDEKTDFTSAFVCHNDNGDMVPFVQANGTTGNFCPFATHTLDTQEKGHEIFTLGTHESATFAKGRNSDDAVPQGARGDTGWLWVQEFETASVYGMINVNVSDQVLNPMYACVNGTNQPLDLEVNNSGSGRCRWSH
jgi:hypothetical protein